MVPNVEKFDILAWAANIAYEYMPFAKSRGVSLKEFKLTPGNVPIAHPSGNRELMHKMTIPFHSRFVPYVN